MEKKHKELSKYYQELLYFINNAARLSNSKVSFPEELNAIRPFHKESFTPIQNDIMIMLYTKGSMSISEIANAEHLIHSTASRTIEGLVKRGFINRFHKGENRKTVYAQLTDLGKNIYTEDTNIYAEYIVRKLEALTDEAGRQKLLDSYKYICEILEKF